MEYKNIALFGKIRSGKNTVADYLTANYQYTQYALGTGIAEIIQKYYPEEWEKGKPRLHYQHIGQQLRELDEEVWLNYMFKSITSTGPNVITDCRQLNEAERLRKEGYLIVKVAAPLGFRRKRMESLGDTFTITNLIHTSEQYTDYIPADWLLYNDGTIPELYTQIELMMAELKGRCR